MKGRDWFARRLLLVVAALVWTNAAGAQPAYPTRQIQLVVTVPPGGAADFVARMVGAKLADALGQPVIIVNRGGAGGTTAAASVAKSDPDGYTLLLNTIATHGIGPHLYANLPYDPAKDFAPVILLARFPLIMTVTASLPARSVADVVALAKARPGELAFASAGTGGAPHLAGELFKRAAAIDLLHVPYRGSGPAAVDLIAGRVAIMIDAAPPLLPFIMSGQVRPLAAASRERHRLLPDVPTFAELGYGRYGDIAVVRNSGSGGDADGGGAAPQWRARQDSRDGGHPQESHRAGGRYRRRHARRFRRVHERGAQPLGRRRPGGRHQAGMRRGRRARRR